MKNDPFAQIHKEKRKLRKEIKQCRESIASQARQMVSPIPQTVSKMQHASSLISRGLAIIEGVRMGMKVARTMRSLFNK